MPTRHRIYRASPAQRERQPIVLLGLEPRIRRRGSSRRTITPDVTLARNDPRATRAFSNLAFEAQQDAKGFNTEKQGRGIPTLTRLRIAASAVEARDP